ncbi:fimbrillin family protein [uncultured Bacteroides sp.]|uniref:fimbrillin family protein n=1 Tax=uncultured Bacteroides sp. TaxID=162156 RepID=UPI0025CEC5E8|nr:fimbrillin family protein [uncultured Bacteroides sp.]
MKAKIIFSVITLFILSACVKESFTNPHNDNIGDLSVTITGNSMWGFSNKNSRAATISQIPENGKIKFYSQGGITADGDTLTLENGLWTGLKNDKWNTSGNDASIAAYYPVINDFSQLYSENGELQDMVWCNTTAKLGDNVNLSFSHMFAKLVINIESELNDTVKDVKVKIPSKISDIDFYTGKLSFLEGGNADVTLPQKYNGKYEIFIPASDKCNIALDITCNKGKKYNPSIDNSEYKAGYEYICNVKLSNKGNGIYTTTDFIAFTHLINNYLIYGNEDLIYNEKRLSDFYVMQDGKRVFNLYNDLSFTEEESNDIKRIGTSKIGFKDIFNGNNHTLKNIIIDNSYTSEMGLFNYIDADGVIKNLIISDCRYNENIRDKISILVGKQYGIINNCHIINCTIYDNKNNRYAGITYSNHGTIINSSISNIKLTNSSGSLGVMCFQNDGNIINCRVYTNLTKSPKGISSSIASVYNNGNIFNIFVEDSVNDLYGFSYNNKEQGQYYNYIIPKSYESKYIGTDYAPSSLLKGISFYQDTAEEYQTKANTLNEWIDKEGKKQYPTLTFRRWTTDPTQKVIFE